MRKLYETQQQEHQAGKYLNYAVMGQHPDKSCLLCKVCAS